MPAPASERNTLNDLHSNANAEARWKEGKRERRGEGKAHRTR
jgi:hypothetical protein